MTTLEKYCGTWSCKMHMIGSLSTGGSCHRGVDAWKAPPPISHINHGHRGPISGLTVNIDIIIISIATVITTITAVIGTTEAIMVAVVANVTIRVVKSHTGGHTYGENDQQPRDLKLLANKNHSTGKHNIHRFVNSIMHATRNCYICYILIT